MSGINKIFSGLFFLAVLFGGCKDVVDVDLGINDIDFVVVEAYLSSKAEDNVSVSLQRTVEVDDTAFNPVINDAIVTLSDDQATPNTVTLEENGTSGTYSLPKDVEYAGVPGRTYILTILLSDGTEISAEEYMDDVSPIDTIKVNSYRFFDELCHCLLFSTQEPEGEGDYYSWNVYCNGEKFSDLMFYSSDEMIDGNYIADDLMILDYGYDDDLLFIGDTIVVDQLSISEDIYDFYYAMSLQRNSTGIFSVPAANVPSNLTSNDGSVVLGFFSASDISTSNSIIIEQSNFDTIFND